MLERYYSCWPSNKLGHSKALVPAQRNLKEEDLNQKAFVSQKGLLIKKKKPENPFHG